MLINRCQTVSLEFGKKKKMLFNIVNLENAQYTSAPKVYPPMLSLSSVFPCPFMRIMMIWSFI